YIDDKLDKKTESIICGVYNVYQYPEMSWWPNQSAWDSSGLNAGYWTPDCEDWYQHRLTKIRANEGDLRSATHWQ
ncbi:hypothetical protein BDN72DRAFT_748162, partial [Pluteus cervinus]